jgi:hypothetical protein
LKLTIPTFRIPDFPLGALFVTVLFAIGLLFAVPDLPSAWLWELIVAIAFVVWAIGAGFSSPRHSELADTVQQEPEGEEKAQDVKQEISDTSSAAIAALISTIKAEGLANRAEERKEDRGKQLREQFTIALLAVTLGAVILQVREMIKVYAPIRAQAEAASDQANAAKTQAAAAQTQANTAKDAVTAGSRAWVGPTNAVIAVQPQIGHEVIVNVSVQNTGKEPAKDFTWTVDPLTISGESTMLSMDMEDYVFRCFTTQSRQHAQVIYPSSGFGTGFEFPVTFSADKIDQNVIDGYTTLVVRGCLTYDTFSKTRHASFCYFYKGNSSKLDRLNICASGSDAD